MTAHEKHQLYLRYKSKRDEIYTPLLKKFISANKEYLQTSGYPWAPFIPYTFHSYGIDGPKIFYIGIDTYYWDTYPQDLFNSFVLDNFEYFFEKNDNIVTTTRILLEWAYDKGTFWRFVCKLQLYIRTHKLYSTEDLRNLALNEVAHIDSIGYGNLNSIERQTTLKKEGSWNGINHEQYWQIKQSSDKLFDKLINILDAYNPDYVIVLSSNINESIFFSGLKYKLRMKHEGGIFRSLYEIENYDTKIVQTIHPSRFSFKSTNDDEMVPYISDSLLLFDKKE